MLDWCLTRTAAAPNEWFGPHREALRRQGIETMVELASAHTERGEAGDAPHVLERAREVDATPKRSTSGLWHCNTNSAATTPSTVLTGSWNRRWMSSELTPATNPPPSLARAFLRTDDTARLYVERAATKA